MSFLLIILAVGLVVTVIGFQWFRSRPQAEIAVSEESDSGGFPPELEPFREKLEATSLPYVKISAKPTESTRLWQSKFRGEPYLPKGHEYPVGRDGRPLALLAQVNFAEAPELPGYPAQGILQFFIPKSDDLYGLCLDGGLDSQLQGSSFEVRYFPEVDEDDSKLTTDFAFLEDEEEDLMPALEHCELRFSLHEHMVPTLDCRFDKLLGEDFFVQFGKKEMEIAEKYDKLSDSSGHRIGGYAYFTQADPRERSEEDWLLLFQMDTDDEAGIMWGDAGVGGFFIRKGDLEKRDFSRVLYNWDCC